MEIRRAQFMGSWYPATATECESLIREFTEGGPQEIEPGVKGVGGVVPHAGWVYSGAIAARVVKALSMGAPPDIVAIFGMHLAPRHPNFIMTSGSWETPFGPLEIAEEAALRLSQGFSFQIETADRHVQDNTIELQLPFIKYFFPKTRILPIGAPPTSRSFAIGEALVDIAAHLGCSLKVLGSTDLTHYGSNYGFSPAGRGAKAVDWVKNENDKKMLDAIRAIDPQKVVKQSLENHNACCGGAVATAMAAAKKMGAQKAQVLDYSTSYDVSPAESFVGYVGAIL